jgi:DNA-binding MarR family transcriptional regulator
MLGALRQHDEAATIAGERAAIKIQAEAKIALTPLHNICVCMHYDSLGAYGSHSQWAKLGAACACFNVRKTARLITQLYDESLRPTGLRVTQFSILMATRGLELATLTRLAEVMAMDRTTLTRNVRPLERQGLIKITPGDDRRERQVSLTPRGHHTLAQALPVWERVQARVTQAFGPERLQRLFTELAELRSVSRSL